MDALVDGRRLLRDVVLLLPVHGGVLLRLRRLLRLLVVLLRLLVVLLLLLLLLDLLLVLLLHLSLLDLRLLLL